MSLCENWILIFIIHTHTFFELSLTKTISTERKFYLFYKIIKLLIDIYIQFNLTTYITEI